MRFDFDSIDEWEPRVTDVLAPMLPRDIAARVRREKPLYVDDARTIVARNADIRDLGLAILTLLRQETVMAYHGTRLTGEDAASIEKDGFKPLRISDRKSRLVRALAGHPGWEQSSSRLDDVLSQFASGMVGAREGQIHFTLSRAGLRSFDHYITHGAEVDDLIARELVGDEGYELLASDGVPMIYKIAVPGEVAVKAANPYIPPEEVFRRGDLPKLASDILNAWSYRLFDPTFQSSSLEIDCGLVFYEHVPAAWIASKEVVEFHT